MKHTNARGLLEVYIAKAFRRPLLPAQLIGRKVEIVYRNKDNEFIGVSSIISAGTRPYNKKVGELTLGIDSISAKFAYERHKADFRGIAKYERETGKIINSLTEVKVSNYSISQITFETEAMKWQASAHPTSPHQFHESLVGHVAHFLKANGHDAPFADLAAKESFIPLTIAEIPLKVRLLD